MSDEPQGPGWWLASDGVSYPPELHPSMQGAAHKVPPVPVPELPMRPTWSGESDGRPEAGPMYPDLFQQAVAGSHLADVVSVNFADGEHRASLDVPQSIGELFGPSDDDLVLASTGARMPAEVGAFTGASAKKRWRLHR